MSVEVWLRGKLEFADDEAIAAANAALAEAGCIGHQDNLLGGAELHWSGTTLTVDLRGSMPYSALDICSSVLVTYAEHAESGEMLAINIEDGVGERIRAGSGDDADEELDDELDDDEVDALREEYGWEG